MEINVPSLVRVKPKALNKVGKYLRQEKLDSIALFYGEGIKELFSDKITISFESSEIKIINEEIVKTSNINEIFENSLKLPSGIKAIVAIGGGKAIDYSKYIAFINKLPLIAIPTVISNDAFCSSVASLYVNNKRKTVKTILPHGVIIDTELIKNSPEKFLYSGMGDLFCKITSMFDWKLSFKKTGEYVNDFAAVMTNNAVDAFLYYENKSIECIDFIRILSSSLMLTGIAMEIAGSSRPASGSEHLISHAYDKVAKNPSLHGLQVGVASYAVSYLQQETHETIKTVIKDSGFFDFMCKNKLNKVDFIEAIKFAPGIKEDFYTILSENNNIERLIKFVEEDEIINQMLE